MRALRLFVAFHLAAFHLAACGPFSRAERRTDPPPPPAASDRIPGTVRVATWNVHRFFDTVCDSGRCGAADFEEQASPERFGMDAERIAEAIEALHADVVLLQEVENEAALRAVGERLGSRFPTLVLAETGFAASMDVAVASTGTLLETHGHRGRTLVRPDGSTTSFSREFFEVHLGFGERRVIAFAAHFRSKNNDDPGRRLAEAQAAQEIVRATAAARPDALVVFGGDLNDVPGSEPLQALEASGELDRVDARAPGGAHTYWYGGRGSALDHLFHARLSSGSVVDGSVRTVGDAADRPYGGSDHAAVRADFQFPH